MTSREDGKERVSTPTCNSITHYMGCTCWEATRQAEIEALRKELRLTQERLLEVVKIAANAIQSAKILAINSNAERSERAMEKLEARLDEITKRRTP